MFDTAISRSSRPSASPESTEWAAACRPSVRSFALPATTSAAAALRSATSRKAESLPWRTSCTALAFVAASPPRSASGLTLRRPSSSGEISKVLTCAVFEGGDAGRPGRGDLVEPVGTVHHPDPLGAEVFQDLRQRLRPLLGEHADHLPPHAGRVGERAEQVEDRARAELGAGRARRSSLPGDAPART